MSSLNEAIALSPTTLAPWYSKGLLLLELDRPAESLEALNRAVELGQPGADVYLRRSACHKALGQLDKAIDDLEKALIADPEHTDTMMSLGIISQELGRLEAAVDWYTHVIRREPARAQTYSNLGAVLFELKRYEDAHTTLKVALDLDRTMTTAWNNLGATLKQLHRLDEALQAFDQTLSLDPTHVETYCHKGVILHDLERVEEALACYERALSVDPDCTLAAWNKAFGLLLSGDFEHGWPQYESRWQHKPLNLKLREYPQPRWTGEDALAGKHVLVYAEQGLGDTLQFSRFVFPLLAQGARVSLEVQPPLRGLLTRCLPGVRVVEMGAPTSEFDFHTPLLSLPGIFQCRPDHVPATAGYLRANTAKIIEWSQRLGARQQPRIGLVWNGNPAHTNDRMRSLDLNLLIEALPQGYDYVCLQNCLRSDDEDILKSNPQLRCFTSLIHDFEDTAALCHLMDLVISVDTSVAHLSASLGQKTWVLVAHSPDWRWMHRTTETFWYKSMKLYRQLTPGDWQQPLQRLISDLKIGYALQLHDVQSQLECSVAV